MKRRLALFFLGEFLGTLPFSLGLFVLYLASRGLTLAEVGLVQTLLFWSNLIFEIPAGILADRFKRKYSLALGYLIGALATLLTTQAEGLFQFAWVWVLYGMGFAFRSGANTALLYDEIRMAGPAWAGRYLRISGWHRALTNTGIVVALALGGPLQVLGWNFVFGAEALCSILAALLLVTLDETPHHKANAEESHRPSVISAISQFLSSSRGRALSIFLISVGLIEALTTPVFVYSQAFFKNQGLSEAAVSTTIAVIAGISTVTALGAQHLARIPFRKLVLGSALLLTATALLFFLNPGALAGALLVGVIDLIPVSLFLHIDNYINARIPTAIRASLLSFKAATRSICISGVYLVGGRMLDQYPSAQVLGSMALLPLMGAVALAYYFRNLEKRVPVVAEAQTAH